MTDTLLFVYGTLRIGCYAPMARWLRSVARHVGPASVRGALYRVDFYPAFVPGAAGNVQGDLFALADPVAIFARLDDYEECAAHHPLPHEYRREQVTAMTTGEPVVAWIYAYALDVGGLERIGSGDFLAG